MQIPAHPDIWVQHRKIDELDCYFLANTNPDQCTLATVYLLGGGYLETWDAATGAVSPCPASEQNGMTAVTLNFAPAGSYLLMRAPMWSLKLDGPNQLVLDTANLKLGWMDWTQPMYILDIQKAILDKGMGLEYTLRYNVQLETELTGPIYLVIETPERFSLLP